MGKMNDKIVKLKARVAELEKRLGINTELWKPKAGEKYYYITDDALITWDDYEYCRTEEKVKIGNYYKTIREAGKELNKLRAIQKVKEYIAKNIGIFEPNWENFDEKKWSVAYSMQYKKLIPCYNSYSKLISPYGFLKNETDCEKLIKNCEKELCLIFGVEYEKQ